MSDWRALWRMKGVVSGRRELTSKKNPDWRGYILNVDTLGASYELQVSDDQLKAIKDGDVAVFQGSFETRSGRVNFVLEEFKPEKAA